MRVKRWECDQCGAHITDKGKLCRVKLEEPDVVDLTGPIRRLSEAEITRLGNEIRGPIRCRKKDVCRGCYDKVLAFLKVKEEK